MCRIHNIAPSVKASVVYTLASYLAFSEVLLGLTCVATREGEQRDEGIDDEAVIGAEVEVGLVVGGEEALSLRY